MKSKGKILFVDDQQNILSGLERMLHAMRNEWDMKFCSSGKDALLLMEKQCFDVIIADIKMPDLDGAQLLKKVEEICPATIRFILSGHSDQELVFQTVGHAHQYIAKPCEPEMLRQYIDRSLRLREELTNEALHSTIAQIKSLPSPPYIYSEIINLIQNEEASLDAISKTIKKDISLTAKLLQMVNSAFFGLPRHVESVMEAVNYLGLNTVQGLVLSAGIYHQFENSGLPGMSMDSIFAHAAAVAANAKKIGTEIGLDKRYSEEAFLSGLLHDIGKLIMVANFPNELKRIIGIVKTGSMEFHEAEREVFGTGHPEIGSHLLSLWGFTDSILEIVAFHHSPDRLVHPAKNVFTAVYIANEIDRQRLTGDKENGRLSLDTGYIEKLGLTDRLPQLIECCTMETKEEGVMK